MNLHPEIRAMLDKAAGQPEFCQLSIQTVRDTVAARNALLERPAVADVRDRMIPGPRGHVPIRIYRPDAVDGRPIVVFFHGGGFVACSIDTHDGLVRQICRRAGVIVVSVGYALAPESKFPAAPDDCLAATLWAAEHAAEIGGDPGRIALAGDSAGGNLAAVTAIRIRDEGGARIAAQLLLYPVTDHYSAGMPSYTERGSGYGLSSGDMRWFWDLYLASATEAAHPFASPNRLPNLKGLPPAYVVTAGYDLLRDEGEAFARRLSEAGVSAVHLCYADMIHGFLKWAGQIDRADEALDAACAWLARMLADPAHATARRGDQPVT